MALDQSAGEISRAIRSIRQLTDDASVQAKYSDSTLLDLLSDSWSEVIGDLYTQAVNPPLASVSQAVTAGVNTYCLPCSVGEIRRIANYDVNGVRQWEIVPSAALSPTGPGIQFEGTQRFRLNPNHNLGGYTIRVDFIPNGSIVLLTGSLAIETEGTSNFSTTTIRLDTTGTSTVYGAVDRRPNAYLGSYLSLTGETNGQLPSGYTRFPVQQRIISAYDVATGTITVDPAFDFDPSTLGSQTRVSFEVYPIEAPIVWPVMTRHVARTICGMENKTSRFKTLGILLQEAKRACIMRWANLETRYGHGMPTTTVNNLEYLYGG